MTAAQFTRRLLLAPVSWRWLYAWLLPAPRRLPFCCATSDRNWREIGMTFPRDAMDWNLIDWQE